MKRQESEKDEKKEIEKLNRQMLEIEKNSLTLDEEKSNINRCIRCKKEHSLILRVFNPLTMCGICQRKVCKECISYKDYYLGRCTYCTIKRSIEEKTGNWYEKGGSISNPNTNLTKLQNSRISTEQELKLKTEGENIEENMICSVEESKQPESISKIASIVEIDPDASELRKSDNVQNESDKSTNIEIDDSNLRSNSTRDLCCDEQNNSSADLQMVNNNTHVPDKTEEVFSNTKEEKDETKLPLEQTEVKREEKNLYDSSVSTSDNFDAPRLLSFKNKPKNTMRSKKETHSSSVKTRENDENISESLSFYSTGKVTGKILVSIGYLKLQQTLTIIIKSVSNLFVPESKNSNANISIKVEIFPDNDKISIFKTKYQSYNEIISWNECFSYPMNLSDLRLRKIIINAWNNKFPKKYFLGEVSIPLNDHLNEILKKENLEAWYQLKEKEEKPEIETNIVVQQYLKLGFIIEKIGKKKGKNNARLIVKVIQATDIASIKPLYKALCEIYLYHKKEHEIKKTTKSAVNVNGVFILNQDVKFEIDRNCFNDYGLKIKLVDGKKTSNIIGIIDLNDRSNTYPWQTCDEGEANAWLSLFAHCKEMIEKTFTLKSP